MQKILSICCAVILLSSCSENKTGMLETAKGSLTISTGVDQSVDDILPSANTPLTDLTGYTLKIDGPDTHSIPCPQDGKIEDLTPGQYEVTLSNMDASFVPAFDNPKYAGKCTSTVIAGKNAQANIVLTQANAGVRFVYDESLAAAGLDQIVPTVTQGRTPLIYINGDEAQTGYFVPGEVIISLDNNGSVVNIDGKPDKTHAVSAKERLTITLKVTRKSGGMSITAVVDSSLHDTEEEIELGGGDSGEPELITFNGQQWMDRNLGAATADFENDWDNAIGNFYQWGRNAAFTATQEIEVLSGPVTAEVADAEENQNKFIKKMNGDWLDGIDNTRWQATDKQPCPAGYRMPAIVDFAGIFTAPGILVNMVNGPINKTESLAGGSFQAQYWADKSKTIYGIKKLGKTDAYYMKWEWCSTSAGKNYVKISRWPADENATFIDKTLADIQSNFIAIGEAPETISFPAAGCIIGSGGYYSSGNGYYWTSSLNGGGAHRAEFAAGKMIAGDIYNSRISGHSIRCIKE